MAIIADLKVEYDYSATQCGEKYGKYFGKLG